MNIDHSWVESLVGKMRMEVQSPERRSATGGT